MMGEPIPLLSLLILPKFEKGTHLLLGWQKELTFSSCRMAIPGRNLTTFRRLSAL